jgi:hypothetical protein
MSEFELLAIPLSLILGLGITHILTGVTDAIRERESVALHWLPFTWAFLIFLFQVQYFFVIWDFHEDGATWTWPVFAPSLFNCVILFLSAGLILPGSRRSDSASLIDDFQKHGRFSLITVALMLLVAILLNVFHADGSLLSMSNLLNVMLFVLVCCVLLVKRYVWQVATTLTFAAIQFYGLLAVWSVPGK